MVTYLNLTAFLTLLSTISKRNLQFWLLKNDFAKR